MDMLDEMMFNMELPDRMKSGRPQRRLMDSVKEHMQRAGVTEVDANLEAMGLKTVTYL